MHLSVRELILVAGERSIAEAVRAEQAEREGVLEDELNEKMHVTLEVMRGAVKEGLKAETKSLSGMTGGGAARLFGHMPGALGGPVLGRAAAYALATAECNAAMGKIVAAPTAGACGILPGALLSMEEAHGLAEERLIDALFTAAGIGRIIAARASISGAEAGCQAECGSASAMAAAALVEMFGGTPDMAADACAFALMNSLGLVCDPVQGLVEVPCVYRNVAGVANAITAADLALSGVKSPIEADEMIDAMKSVGDQLPASLRETGEGGCAACRLRQDLA